ncbi:hypothetical protein K2173_018617 [Erythroxylum novogranatense]|uniref:Uncharacterized protein n=1 Tax=Erythroxylum novogranatense TaxID=1862640 RepID=A0AAV8UB79_9ROSI|nr:hypothetical protein K2173_018617 [Erythroxylum novogranatense]
MSTKIDIPAVSSAVAKVVALLIGGFKHESVGRYNKGFAIFDFLLRLGRLIAADTMGTHDETLPFFTQLSSNFSVSHGTLTLNAAAAIAAAGKVYLAHNGNTSANWPTIWGLLPESQRASGDILCFST